MGMLPAAFVCPIGIGRGLTASPLPHHRTYGSRIRRFGRWSQGVTPTPTRVSAPDVPVIRSSQTSDLPAHASPDAIEPLHPERRLLSTVRAFPPLRVVLCRLLTSARRSGRIPPPSVPYGDTSQISRGKLSYRRCIDAGFIKYAPWWMEDFVVACPLVPGVPHLISGSCPSPRTFVPRCLQTPPHGDALALPWSFGSTNTWTGDFHPQA
jgi:hypothetical protein